MAKSQILTGARAKIMLTIGDGPNATIKTVALFNNCTWQIRQGKEPAFILGRFSPAEITPTTQESVSMTLSGFRIIEQGPYTMGVSKLQDLLNEGDFMVSVEDRQTKKTIFKAHGCRIQGWSSGVAARGVSDIRLDVIGMIGEDESGAQEESEGANSI